MCKSAEITVLRNGLPLVSNLEHVDQDVIPAAGLSASTEYVLANGPNGLAEAGKMPSQIGGNTQFIIQAGDEVSLAMGLIITQDHQ